MPSDIDLSQFHFGDRIADDYPPSAGGDQWIRGFRDPVTQIRICPATRVNREGKTVTGYRAWVKGREHYDNNLKISYPCLEELGGTEPDGMGCHHPDEKVRRKPQKWYLNALDKEGELHIYKIGLNLWEMFRSFQDMSMGEDPTNTQPLSERDYHIMKSGSELKTKYFAQSGNAYEVDFSELEMHNIGDALKASFEEALAIYSGDSPLADDLIDTEDDVADWGTQINDRQEATGGPRIAPKAASSSGGQIQPKGARTAKKAAAAPAEVPSAAKEDEPVSRPAAKKLAPAKKAALPSPAQSNGTMTPEELEDMDLEPLRAWVAEHAPASYELPANMSRSRLYKVGVAIISGDDPPF